MPELLRHFPIGQRSCEITTAFLFACSGIRDSLSEKHEREIFTFFKKKMDAAQNEKKHIPCSGLRKELKDCIMSSDCVLKVMLYDRNRI